MTVTIRLLGTPQVLRDGAAAPTPRGHKVWGLLAYLLLHPRGVSRRQLADLLFEDAEDPLAALRWNLSELRRALGDINLRGEVLEFSSGCAGHADVEVLSSGSWSDAINVPGLGCDLLEGMSFTSSPSFQVWLEGQRRRLHATAQSVLREAALARLATGAAHEAADLAARLVGLDPLDESFQVLLVRCLAASGAGVAAACQAAACRALFQRELGQAPGPALDSALMVATAAPTTRPASGRAGAIAQMEAGEAAISAGVLEAGLQCLRRAVVDADVTGDPVLRARARVALGGALVHAARGRDEEGAATLHEALIIGQAAAPIFAAAACRELAYVEFLRGSYDRAMTWLRQAQAAAGGDPAEQARITTLRGSILSDTAHYALAIDTLRQAQEQAGSAGDLKQLLYAQAMEGRAALLCGDLDGAAVTLERSVQQARHHWTAFLPWPLSFLGEVDLERARVDAASERFEHAFALGCQLGDPCWEGIAARGLGRVAAARRETERATALLMDSIARCVRVPDAYLWGRCYSLDALSQHAVAQRLPQARAWVDELSRLSSRSGMRELMVRSSLHHAALGEPMAAATAQLLMAEIDNPALRARVGANEASASATARIATFTQGP